MATKVNPKKAGKLSQQGPSQVQRLTNLLDGVAGEVPSEVPAEKAARVTNEAVKKKKRNTFYGG